MKITLTYAEGRSVMVRVSDELAEAMHEVRKHCWHKSHVYDLPPIAWRRILDELRAVAYGPRGGYKTRSDSLYTGIAKITEAVIGCELHPAYKDGRGVAGISTDVLPGFLSSKGRSPYPPGRFTVLMPQHLHSHGRTVTTWFPRNWSPSKEPCHSESFHLRFWVESGVGDTEHRRVPEL